jgi:predicted RNase H-like HicB family nuclease
MAQQEDESHLRKDLVWHQRRILRQRQQAYQVADEEHDDDADYDDVLPAKPDLLKFRQNETGNVKRFLALHWGFVHYSTEQKTWMVGNGRHWKFSNLRAYHLATQAMILFAQQAGVFGPRSESAKMRVMRYRVYLEPDEDGVFVATCPTLPGCVSQGRTRAEAAANIREAIEGYLKSLKKHGDPVPPSILEEVIEVAG